MEESLTKTAEMKTKQSPKVRGSESLNQLELGRSVGEEVKAVVSTYFFTYFLPGDPTHTGSA